MAIAAISSSSSAAILTPTLRGSPQIGAELATLPYDYRVTLDANEQYADLAALGALVDHLDNDAALQPIASKLLYIEQPMPRDITLQSPSARWHRGTSSSTRPTIPGTHFPRQRRSAIAASRRNPAKGFTSRSSMRRVPRNGAAAASITLSPARISPARPGSPYSRIWRSAR